VQERALADYVRKFERAKLTSRRGGMRRVTDNERSEWKRLYEERELSVPAIAHRAGRNPHVVYYTLLRLGTVMRTGQVGAEVTGAEEQRWLNFFLQGEAPEEFDQTRTPQTIYKHLAPMLLKEYIRLRGGES